MNRDRMTSNVLSRDDSTSLDRSSKKSEIETSWLRANQDRRYRIRGLEQDYNSVDKNETGLYREQ